MSCGVGRRCGLDPTLLWLWCRPAVVVPIGPLAWEYPYAVGTALKSKKKKKKELLVICLKVFRIEQSPSTEMLQIDFSWNTLQRCRFPARVWRPLQERGPVQLGLRVEGVFLGLKVSQLCTNFSPESSVAKPKILYVTSGLVVTDPGEDGMGGEVW